MKRMNRTSELSPSKWSWIGAAAAAILGVVFLVAAVPKALDPIAFAEQIRFEGLDFILPAGFLAWLVIVVETVLGVALVLDLRRRSVLVPTGALVVFFVFLTARAYLRWTRGELDEGASCGCFGNLVDRSPAEAFWQDLFLLVPPFLLAAFLPKRRRDGAALRWRAAVVLALAFGVGVLAWASPQLPLDDAATRLGVGSRVVDICAGAGRPGAPRVCLDLLAPELLEGRHLVVIDELDSPEIAATVEALDGLGSEGSVWLLADASDEEVQAFFWQWGPQFRIAEVPLGLLRPLYRTLPRAFEVGGGVVTRTWAGLPEPHGGGG